MTKSQKKIYEWLMSKPGYLKSGIKNINLYFSQDSTISYSLKDLKGAIKQAKLANKLGVSIISPKQTKKVSKTVKKVLNVIKKQDPLSVIKAEELIKSKNSKIKVEIPKFKRLFFDIEVSPNIVFSWNVGYKLMIPPDNIIQERAIICICWKWAGESKVHSLEWNKGDDKEMIAEFMETINSADEVIGHNGDGFDIKWLRTRCIYHGIPAFPDYQSLDTLKLARSGFRFNSNKLDYLGGFLGVGKKMDAGGFSTWRSIVLDNDTKALDKMVKYCKVDVIRLEQVYDKLNPYTKAKTHVGVILDRVKSSCPNCGSSNTAICGSRVSAMGIKKKNIKCKDCNKYFSILASNVNK